MTPEEMLLRALKQQENALNEALHLSETKFETILVSLREERQVTGAQLQELANGYAALLEQHRRLAQSQTRLVAQVNALADALDQLLGKSGSTPQPETQQPNVLNKFIRR